MGRIATSMNKGHIYHRFVMQNKNNRIENAKGLKMVNVCNSDLLNAEVKEHQVQVDLTND